MNVDGLFVYGTLREGGIHRAWLERTHPEGSTPAHVPGRLFHLPEAGYPALVPVPLSGALPPGPGWVAGDFVGYGDAAELERALEDLDTLEGVEAGCFSRRVLPVLLSSGACYAAWVYVFEEDRLPRLEREAVELSSGDWSGYL